MKPEKPLFAFVFPLLLFCVNGFCQVTNSFDSMLAKKLGADEYGMKYYTFVILKTGSNKITDKAKLDSIFRGHLANIHRLADRGDLALAGPFGENPNNYRGLYIFNVQNVEEVKKLLETDPAVKSKLLEPEIYPWYGSAGVQQINDLHKKIAKTSF
ncbi:MAG: hypothetical protein JST75_10895 [Bacteroidetes bacterium]|nr:hypothetical protein [Bacteroidota bacterium]